MAEMTKQWWQCEGRELSAAISGVMKRAIDATNPRRERIKVDLGDYLNRNITELDGWAYDESQRRRTDGPRLNLARSVVDTTHSKLSVNLPRTTVLTEGGSWHLQRQAKALDAFIEGVKYESDWRTLFPLMLRDAMVADTGVVHVYGERCEDDGEKRGRICIKRVLPWEIHVDPEEAIYGEPRSLFRMMTIDRSVAIREWPDREADIREAPRATRGVGSSYGVKSDRIAIVEAWHRESGDDADDGLHVIALLGSTSEPLEAREWDGDRFPIEMLSWSAPFVGVWGSSLVDEVSGIHQTLNEVDATIRDRVRQSFGILINYMGAKLKLRIDNEVGIAIIDAEGGERGDVDYYSPSLVNQELLGERERLISLGYQMPGVSQLSAGSLKPAGLDSRVALREYQDIESERFATFSRAVEAFDLAVSKRIIAVAKELDDDGYPVIVSAKTEKRRRKGLQKIDFSKVRMRDGSYELQVFPSSQLPRQPAGRLAMVEQLIAAGFLEKDEALRLLDFPDVEATMSSKLAPYSIALDMVELILEDGRRVSPIPEMNLVLTRRVVNLAILQATMDEAPEDRIEMLRRFAAQVDALQQRAESAMQPAPGAGPEGFVPTPAGQMQPGLPANAAPQGAPVIG